MKGVCRVSFLIVVVVGIAVSGCESSSNDEQAASATTSMKRKRPAAGQIETSRRPRRESRPRRAQAKNRSAIRTRTARTGGNSIRPAAFGATEATRRALSIVEDSVDFSPTLVVWLVDVSPSAMQWATDVHRTVTEFYQSTVPSLCKKQPDRLQTAVLTISKQVEFVVRLTEKSEEVVEAFNALSMEKSGREVTFDAVRQAQETYLSSRVQQRREVLFVIITDEAGDDWSLVDQLIGPHRKYAMPVYVVGVPAPFGRHAALDERVEIKSDGRPRKEIAEPKDASEAWRPILQGPESRYAERIHLEFDDEILDLELIDSGFGPFALERLCRASGGAFIAVREGMGGSYISNAQRRQWPTYSTARFDPKVLRRYAPDDLNDDDYRTLLQENQARLTLHKAAQLPLAGVMRNPQVRFLKRSEADLKNRLDKAQQTAAKAAPAVNQIYQLLRDGSGASQELTRPRWKAAFGLAFGRACAAKARIDGYNAMLAALKRGRSFEKPGSKTWVLERFETNEASSSLQNLIKRAQNSLQGVVDDHPGTPWAKIAQAELEIPMGWRWTEQP